MKLPRICVPERDMEEHTQNLLEGRPIVPEQVTPEQLSLQDAFKELKRLIDSGIVKIYDPVSGNFKENYNKKSSLENIIQKDFYKELKPVNYLKKDEITKKYETYSTNLSHELITYKPNKSILNTYQKYYDTYISKPTEK